MENKGFVNSLMSGSRKSSIFCEARITELSFLRTRFMALRIEQTLYAKAQEGVIGDVGVSVEILRFCADAHKVKSETYLL